LSYSWFQTSQTGGQWYNDTSPLVFPDLKVVCWTPNTKVAQQSVTRFSAMIVTNSVTPTTASKPELLFSKTISVCKSKIPAHQCDQIYNCRRYDSGRTLMCYIGLRSSTSPPLRTVCWTPMVDLSNTTKCEQIYSCQRYFIGHTFVLLKLDLDGQEAHLWGQSVEHSRVT
jgi:hypothetical protein